MEKVEVLLLDIISMFVFANQNMYYSFLLYQWVASYKLRPAPGRSQLCLWLCCCKVLCISLEITEYILPLGFKDRQLMMNALSKTRFSFIDILKHP